MANNGMCEATRRNGTACTGLPRVWVNGHGYCTMGCAKAALGV